MSTSETLKPSKKKKKSPPPTDDGASITCEYCGDTVPTLISVDAGLRISLQTHAGLQKVPDAVCAGCHSILSKMISMGAVLKSQAQVKEQNRLMLWRNRVNLVRKAKEHLAQREYGEAAVHYEKYLRVLELVFDKKPGELKPDLFSSEARRQEMTVVTSVYWDLMRIYDQSPRYKDRQRAAAAKLVEFVRFTPIYGYIMRKADILTRTAKNPEVFKEFLKLSNRSRPRCFVASAAFEGAPDPTVEVLRLYRDRVLRQHPVGRRFTLLYYRYSPPLARAIDQGPEFIRATLRFLLRKAANYAGKSVSRASRPSEPRERS
ncbi:hypothetical protein BH10BDE1_BH10BDE1_29820 [soil metagenome]